MRGRGKRGEEQKEENETWKSLRVKIETVGNRSVETIKRNLEKEKARRVSRSRTIRRWFEEICNKDLEIGCGRCT